MIDKMQVGTGGAVSGDHQVSVSAEMLGKLAFLAAGYDRRLTGGLIPQEVWALMPQKWRDKVHCHGEAEWDEK
jgi:hypothetical protein